MTRQKCLCALNLLAQFTGILLVTRVREMAHQLNFQAPLAASYRVRESVGRTIRARHAHVDPLYERLWKIGEPRTHDVAIAACVEFSHVLHAQHRCISNHHGLTVRSQPFLETLQDC